MAKKRAFISFDFDHGEELRNALVGQAKNPDSPLNIAGWSVQEPFTGNWKKKVRDLACDPKLIRYGGDCSGKISSKG